MKGYAVENDNPNEVSSESQVKRIKKYLKSGESVTDLEALELFQCRRLASRITDIQHEMQPVEGVFVKVKKSGKHVKAYFIDSAIRERYHVGADADAEFVRKLVKRVTEIRINGVEL